MPASNSSVQQSYTTNLVLNISCAILCSVVSDSRLPCPLPSPGVFSNSCPLSQVMPSNHLILCCPLLLLPSLFLVLLVFSNESALCIWWPKYWSFSIRPSSEYSGLISFKMTGLISLLSKELSGVSSSITVRKHQFFNVQPSLWSTCHIHIWLLEKNIDLTIQTFVSKVLSLLFNILSKFVIAFL